MKKLIMTGLMIYGGYFLLKRLSEHVCITIKIEKPEKTS